MNVADKEPVELGGGIGVAMGKKIEMGPYRVRNELVEELLAIGRIKQSVSSF